MNDYQMKITKWWTTKNVTTKWGVPILSVYDIPSVGDDKKLNGDGWPKVIVGILILEKVMKHKTDIKNSDVSRADDDVDDGDLDAQY